MSIILGASFNNNFVLAEADRLRHVYVLGQTGTGKSTFLKSCLVQDIIAGRGVGLIDPDGRLADDLLRYIPPSRMDDVVYFNPADLDFPIGFNPLRQVPRDRRHLVQAAMITTFKRLWSDAWGPRMDYILKNSVAALLDYQDASLLGLKEILTNPFYRNRVLGRCENPSVLAFWRDEFETWEKRYRLEAIAPIQNKIGQFFVSTPLCNIFGQVKNAIDFRRVMDKQQIFIANLSYGRLGEDAGELLGSILVSQIELAAFSRADTRKKLPPFFLSIDEFQNYQTDSFPKILSEARKYGLALTTANQYLEQLTPEVRAAVLGNVGTLVLFRVGHSDAGWLEEHLSDNTVGTYKKRDFSSLANGNALTQLLVDGYPNKLEPMTMNRCLETPVNHAEKIIRYSQKRFGTQRRVVEEKLKRWMVRG